MRSVFRPHLTAEIAFRLRPQYPNPYSNAAVRPLSAEIYSFGQNLLFRWALNQFSGANSIVLRPKCSLTAAINPFGRISLSAKIPSYGRKALLRPQLTLLAAILLRPKVSVTAAIRLSSCGRITVAAVRAKGPFGRSLISVYCLCCVRLLVVVVQ